MKNVVVLELVFSAVMEKRRRRDVNMADFTWLCRNNTLKQTYIYLVLFLKKTIIEVFLSYFRVFYIILLNSARHLMAKPHVETTDCPVSVGCSSICIIMFWRDTSSHFYVMTFSLFDSL